MAFATEERADVLDRYVEHADRAKVTEDVPRGSLHAYRDVGVRATQEPKPSRWTDGILGLVLPLLLHLSSVSVPADAAEQSYNYLLHCGGCHLEDGAGMEGVVPDLNEHLGWFASTEEGRSYLIRVPGSAQSPIDDAQLARLLNWMVGRFAPETSPAPAPFTEKEVAASRRIPLDDAVSARASLLEQRETVSAAGRLLSPVERESFGKRLFFDEGLSAQRNQSCATCHDPARAYSDARPSSIAAGASLGSDGFSLGYRNAPSLTYAGSTPAFTLDGPPTRDPLATAADAIRGGFFWDGRQATLRQQVLEPFLNAREMGLGSPDTLVARIREEPAYRDYLTGVEDEAELLFLVTDSLASFLRSDELNRFNSRYDRFLRGKVELTREEEVGMGLFFSPAFTNCTECHQSESDPYSRAELFTNHRYANIGTPANELLLRESGMGKDFLDQGLAGNPVAREALADTAALQGRFKVNSLRNVAVTAPYMHNGVFNELSTVLLFYNHFNASGGDGQINPETGRHWKSPDFPNGVDRDRLRSGFPLSPRQLSALTAFLRMLTDKPYEVLLEEDGF